MHNNKVIRSICYFTNSLETDILEKVEELARRLEFNGYLIQTKRICSKGIAVKEIDSAYKDPSLYLSVGTLDRDSANSQFHDFLNAGNVAFNLDLSSGAHLQDTDILFKIIQKQPGKTFSFAYTFNNLPSSPYFPSAAYQHNGFSIGLQPTDLSDNCKSIDEWLHKMRSVWDEIRDIFKSDSDFLGIDSSIAPLFTGKSSLIHFIKKLYDSFSVTMTKDLYLKITEFIKNNNPKPIGLCGIMLPCLEDFELAAEYQQGNFTIERNIYLSLHSGLGIDTYPIGIDESPARIFEILCLLHGLSQKYNKPLSARFVSDGRAKIGDMTDLKNQYLKDVVVHPL
jgi:hypothetical protein